MSAADDWTPLEDRFIRENYRRLSADEIAGKLGRSPGAVMAYAVRKNLHLPRGQKGAAAGYKEPWRPGDPIPEGLW